MVGKHIYYNESNDNQLKTMLEKYDELHDQDKHMNEMFSAGKRIHLHDVIIVI
jgi:hypothetical protein